MAACVDFVYFGLPNWICRGTEELTMKVGDLVRKTVFDFYGKIYVVIDLEETLNANGPVTIVTFHDGRRTQKRRISMLRKVE